MKQPLLLAAAIAVALIPAPYGGSAEPPSREPTSGCWTKSWEGVAPWPLALLAEAKDEQAVLWYEASASDICS
jgi:hypothetical protein